jgi:hydroxymethylpyrimidine kinase/phosphomethylpyrimidine kinase
MNSAPRPACALTIAGSDSGGGAGIQADLKTFAAHRVHGLSAIAALTAQHTRGVIAVNVPDTGFLRAQIDACFDDFAITAVKLGMLANAGVIETVADALEHYRPAHVVLDPVMVSTSGARLLEASALDALRTRLIPLATLVTPNLPEAELLLDASIADVDAMHAAIARLHALGARAVLLKGRPVRRSRRQRARNHPSTPATGSARHRLHAGLRGGGQPLPRPRPRRQLHCRRRLRPCRAGAWLPARQQRHPRPRPFRRRAP